MKRKNPNHSKNSNFSLAHVLYQKLGNDWYAFTEVDGDCFMAKVEDGDVDSAVRQNVINLEEGSKQSRKRRAA